MMFRLALLCCTALVLFASPVRPGEPASGEWKAGVARINITPERLMWMSGYSARTKPAEGKRNDLWAKALALEDPKGRRAVLITMDLVGIPREIATAVCGRLKAKHGLAREALILNVSHTHCGPVVGSNLAAMYFLDETQQKLVADYARTLEDKLVAVAGEALGALAPARLTWGSGRATFAVNRRNNKEADVPRLREAGQLKGPVDHDVPVLAVRDPKGRLRAVVFGYACHATVLSFYQWSGDYPGFAQEFLEKAHPGAVALFWAGCGGDQNPLPRRRVELAEQYGRQLADAVAAVLQKEMVPIAGSLAMAYTEIDLPFAELPTREQLLKDRESDNRYIARRAQLLLQRLESDKALRGSYPYPVQVWQIGSAVTLVALGGEVVVDYALRLKKELGEGTTWVAGYSNDVMAYIPSLRVLQEGGYEGGGAMVYYGQPSAWSPRVEELIVAAVHEQVKKVRGRQAP
ncbi:MAG TPA: neutral/alkaline non-lysosomal ceramidase N-terminal domain-containing protein [Gemmataceae bacterium]|nr:neutral/alkaline non-lysosomal ceramidase N-terminal domain-containing protein [Gemmataceae bacterium]